MIFVLRRDRVRKHLLIARMAVVEANLPRWRLLCGRPRAHEIINPIGNPLRGRCRGARHAATAGMFFNRHVVNLDEANPLPASQRPLTWQ